MTKRRGWMAAVLAVALTLPAAAQAPAPSGGYVVTEVARGLDHPWSVAFLPDGTQLVTERAGRLRLLRGGWLSPPIAGVPAVFVRGQGGLFDVLPHPRFAENRLIYLSYSAGDRGENAVRIARARLESNRLTGLRVIFEAAPLKDTPVHYGGRMAWLPDGTLVMTTGDGFDYREAAQKTDGLLGKVIRIRDDGSAPPDNPFVGLPKVRDEIWTLGHRNPQGLAVDPANGRLYAHEHGPRGGDEINVLVKGANYGWPIATRGRDYSGASISPFQTYPAMRDALLVWTPSIAPSGLAVYRGTMFPEWSGDLFVGALVDKELRRIDLDAAGRVVGQQSLFKDQNARIRDVRVAPDGALWLLTDDANGRVLRVSRRSPTPTIPPR
jgi:aldose sugar dehydrogenase